MSVLQPISVVFLLLLTAGSIVLSWVLTWLVLALALRRNLVAVPNARSSHTTPTPTGAGVAVLATIVLALLVGGFSGAVPWSDVVTFGAAIIALGAVGWMDDRKSLPAAWRLGTHAFAAVWTLLRIGGFPGLTVGESVVPLGAFGYVIGIVGILWSINLFNFMDGIDGLAGSQAVLIFGAASAGLWLRGNQSLSLVAAVIAAASLGFLAWNWPPAKIFLGDVGSGPLGYLIAALAIASENRAAMPLIAFAILGGVFIADATVTLVRRVRRGHSAAEAHREHAYQRMTRAWSGHAPVTVSAAIVTLSLAILAAAATASAAMLMPALGVAAVLLGALFLAVERRAPMQSAGPAAPPAQ